MGKLIWKGFDKQGEKISSRPFAITGANLRKSSGSKSSKTPKKPVKNHLPMP